MRVFCFLTQVAGLSVPALEIGGKGWLDRERVDNVRHVMGFSLLLFFRTRKDLSSCPRHLPGFYVLLL